MVYKKVIVEPDGGDTIETAVIQAIPLVIEKRCDVQVQHSDGRNVTVERKEVINFVNSIIERVKIK